MHTARRVEESFLFIFQSLQSYVCLEGIELDDFATQIL